MPEEKYECSKCRQVFTFGFPPSGLDARLAVVRYLKNNVSSPGRVHARPGILGDPIYQPTHLFLGKSRLRYR